LLNNAESLLLYYVFINQKLVSEHMFLRILSLFLRF